MILIFCDRVFQWSKVPLFPHLGEKLAFELVCLSTDRCNSQKAYTIYFDAMFFFAKQAVFDTLMLGNTFFLYLYFLSDLALICIHHGL